MKIFKTVVGLAAVGALSLASQANAQISNFVYDTTAGVNSSYVGDFDNGGTLSLSEISGRSFRVQRIPVGPGDAIVETGTFGTGGASFSASMFFAGNNGGGFNDAGNGGPGDTADFFGLGLGSDFTIADEFGHTITGNVDFFQLTDRTNAINPGIEGQGILTDIVFSHSTFQDITTSDLETDGTIFTFTFVIDDPAGPPGTPLTLRRYLELNGLGGALVEAETIEARIKGIPLPATTGLAFAGLLPFCAVSMRRRR